MFVYVHLSTRCIGGTRIGDALKYIHTEKDINSYNEVHTYSIVITLHACGLWICLHSRSSVGSYSCLSGCEYFEVCVFVI